MFLFPIWSYSLKKVSRGAHLKNNLQKISFSISLIWTPFRLSRMSAIGVHLVICLHCWCVSQKLIIRALLSRWPGRGQFDFDGWLWGPSEFKKSSIKFENNFIWFGPDCWIDAFYGPGFVVVHTTAGHKKWQRIYYAFLIEPHARKWW